MPDPLEEAPAAPPTGSFAALAHLEYRRLWVSGFLVFFAVMAQNIARGWLALEITGSNAGLGGVLMGFGVLMLVATPFGGVAADRLSKRLVVLAATALLGFTSGVIGLAVLADAIEYWMLVVASGLQAVAFAFFGPARMAFISELLPDATVGNGIVLGQMSAEASRVVGPAIAGLLIGVLADGTATVFLLSAALSAVSFVLCLTLPPGHAVAGRPARSVLGEIGDGVAYVRQHDGLRLLVLTSLGVVILGFPYIAFLPTLADEIFDVGSGGYGFMSAVSAAGAVVAALLTARTVGPVRQVRDLGRAGLLFGAAVVVLGAAPHFAVALGVLAFAGAAGLWFQTTNQSLLLSIGAFEFHGRIQSLVMLGFSGFGIAALPLGVLADAIGLRTTFALMGGVVALISLLFVRRSGPALGPSLRTFEPPV
ncbi:MAG TPA: MFS transporter [Acidimicrobiales bacterium]|nr:MFS transporter [Acidimicrobiales bacterium]